MLYNKYYYLNNIYSIQKTRQILLCSETYGNEAIKHDDSLHVFKEHLHFG